MKISLCMIVKDEEKYIEQCLEPIAPFVDQIVIIDTGSQDNTKRVARKYTSQIYDFKNFDDFSKARNDSLKYAMGDWILSLDADERLDLKNFTLLKDELQRIDDNKIMAFKIKKYNLFKNGGWYISTATKVFRKSEHIQYEGEINESPNNSIKKAGGQILDSRVYINHVGHMKTAASRRLKNQKYISLFERRLLHNPNDLGLLGYLAVLNRAEGDFEKAKKLCDMGDTLVQSRKSPMNTIKECNHWRFELY